jgi:C-terminal processing protease CtpA/Prc
MPYRRPLCLIGLLATAFILARAHSDKQQSISRSERSLAFDMLRDVKEDVKQNYYDRNFNGLDLDARFEQAREKIKAATSLNQALSDVAAALAALHDSHTYFVPPPRPYKHFYGWHMVAVGDSDCYITWVQPGSDAETQGVKPGDKVLTVNGFAAIRDDLHTINYVFNLLRPQGALQLVLRSPDGIERKLELKARFQETQRLVSFNGVWDLVRQQERENLQHVNTVRIVEYGKQAILVKLPDFAFGLGQGDDVINQIAPHAGMVLDLRGNPGGYEVFLSQFLGAFFDHPVKVSDRIGRKGVSTLLTQPHKGKTFTGKVVVLVDSDSASAAELFARVMQLEHRGIVIGDRSSGSVMEGRFFQHNIGIMTTAFYGASVTTANLIMTDGKSLEHVGVVPDMRVLPLPSDLAAHRDPALARAAALLGLNISPEEAGKLFPLEWRN